MVYEKTCIVSVINYVIYLYIFSDGVKLNDYILDYQPLDYDRIAVHNSHQRVRRSVDKNFYLKFSAFGRYNITWIIVTIFNPHYAFQSSNRLKVFV